jgi:hypothetical protein
MESTPSRSAHDARAAALGEIERGTVEGAVAVGDRRGVASSSFSDLAAAIWR